MKQIIILTTIILFTFACKNENNSTKVNLKDTTLIEFAENSFDFGSLVQGEQIIHSFKFKNIGDKPLIISEVHLACGCTAADYSNEPINPQSESYINITFNSSGKNGNQYKTITIISNTKPEKTVLTITGDVIVPKK